MKDDFAPIRKTTNTISGRDKTKLAEYEGEFLPIQNNNQLKQCRTYCPMRTASASFRYFVLIFPLE